MNIKAHLMFTEDNLDTPHIEFCKKFGLDFVILTRPNFSKVNSYCIDNQISFELIAPGKEQYYFTNQKEFGVYNLCLYSHKSVKEKNLTTLLKCLTMGQDHAMILQKMNSEGLYAYVKHGHINFDPKTKNEYCVIAYGFRKNAKEIPPLFESVLSKKAYSAQKQTWIFNDGDV